VTYFKPLAKWAARRGLMNGGFGELERPAQATKKQLVSSQADVSELLRSLNGSSRSIAVRVMLLTGARCNEVCKAVWSEFDLDRGVWTLPGWRRKNSKPGRLMPDHVMPLPAGLVALLRTIGPGPRRPRCRDRQLVEMDEGDEGEARGRRYAARV
jgi:integrase